MRGRKPDDKSSLNPAANGLDGALRGCLGFLIPVLTLLSANQPSEIPGCPELYRVDSKILPSIPCYELVAQSVDGRRKLRSTVIRHFMAMKITVEETLVRGSF